MRICIFADVRAPHIQRIAPDLVAHGLEVHVVCNQPVPIPGVTMERFSVPRPSLSNPRRWKARWEHYLAGFMRQFDAVQIHFLYDWGFTPEIIEQGCFMAYPWGSDIVAPPDNACFSPELVDARRMMIRKAAAVHVCSPRFARQVADFADVAHSDVELLPMGVDLDRFRPAGRRPAAPKDGCTVGFFKGFKPVYGAPVLMRAIPSILRVYPKTRFEMVGDGPELETCQEMAGAGGFEQSIRWIARQQHSAIPELLDRWDLTVIPSLCESFGLAALEASAAGVPVVASNVGGLPDTVCHGVTGLLVRPDEPENLARTVIELLGDPERRAAMGRSGRCFVQEHYDWRELLGRWIEAYAAAIDRVHAAV